MRARISYKFYFQNLYYQYGAVSRQLGDLGTAALGAQYLSARSQSGLDNSGAATGVSFRPNDLALSMGMGRSIGSLDLGTAFKYISSQIQSNASTWAADAGAEYQARFSDTMSMAIWGGYNSRIVSQRLGGLSGVTLGWGLAVSEFRLDYAWISHGDLGNTHYVGAGVRWGNQSGREGGEDGRGPIPNAAQKTGIVPGQPDSNGRALGNEIERLVDEGFLSWRAKSTAAARYYYMRALALARNAGMSKKLIGVLGTLGQ